MECGRLPLALITVGRAMHDKMDPKEWEQALVLLEQARLYDVEFSSSSMSVFHILKFSYDNLKTDALKECFLHCSLWPEDWKIKRSDLVELWMGLGLIDEPEIQMAYNTGYNYIRRLQAVCLLEETKYEDCIKMHDVIHDMALWISNNKGVEKDKWIVQAGTYKKHKMIKVSHETEKLSLMYNSKKKFSFSFLCSSTKVSALLLGGNLLEDARTLQLESFCELTVLDLSGNIFKSTFPIEICKLVQLQFLNLSGNKRIKSLPKELEALIYLKYILLRETGCTIPKGVLSKLKALRMLDSKYYKLERDNDMEIFSSLEQELQYLPEFQALGISISSMHDFEKLSQTTSVPVRWLNIQHLNNEECLSFTSCFLANYQLKNNLTDLCLTYCNPMLVKFERETNNHRNCCLRNLERLEFVRMKDMKQIVWKGLYPKDVFPRLQIVYFWDCDHLKSISWVVCLPCIQELQVGNCTSMKQLICIDELNDDAIRIIQPYFPLKRMSLGCNDKLENISDPMITFPSLELLQIMCCNKLKKLPFKTDNPPKSLELQGSEEWWDSIEMEDSSHRSLLQPFFTKFW